MRLTLHTTPHLGRRQIEIADVRACRDPRLHPYVHPLVWMRNQQLPPTLETYQDQILPDPRPASWRGNSEREEELGSAVDPTQTLAAWDTVNIEELRRSLAPERLGAEQTASAGDRLRDAGTA